MYIPLLFRDTILNEIDLFISNLLFPCYEIICREYFIINNTNCFINSLLFLTIVIYLTNYYSLKKHNFLEVVSNYIRKMLYPFNTSFNIIKHHDDY